MTGVEPATDALFVGLEDAERRLPAAAGDALDRISKIAIVLAIIAAQLAWLGAFGYAAYLFVL